MSAEVHEGCPTNVRRWCRPAQRSIGGHHAKEKGNGLIFLLSPLLPSSLHTRQRSSPWVSVVTLLLPPSLSGSVRVARRRPHLPYVRLPRFRVRDLFSAPREISLYPSRPICASQTPAIHFAVSLWSDGFVLLIKKNAYALRWKRISLACVYYTHTPSISSSVRLSHSRSPFFSPPCRFLHHLFWRLGIDDRAPRPELGLWTVARDRRRPHGAGWRAPVPLFRKWSHRISAATHYSPVAERPALSDAYFPCGFLLKAVENKQNTHVGRGG